MNVTEEVATWFSLHDGSGSSLDGAILTDNMALSLHDAVETTAMIRSIWAEDEPGQSEDTSGDVEVAGEVVGTWLHEYLMIGTDTLGGGYFVDLRPGLQQGCVRYWDKVEADIAGVKFPDLASLVSAITESVRGGSRIDRWTVTIVDGALAWDDAE